MLPLTFESKIEEQNWETLGDPVRVLLHSKPISQNPSAEYSENVQNFSALPTMDLSRNNV